jgi:hypothetical protein
VKSATTNYPVQKVDTTRVAPPDTNGQSLVVGSSGPGVTLPSPGVVPRFADSAALNCAVFYSTTQSKLAFKDPSGAVHLISTMSP